MAFIFPLDLQKIFVNTFAGNFEIFIFISFIAIAALAARFRMPNIIVGIIFALFAIFMASYFQGIFFIAVLLSGIAVFYGIGSLIKR